MLLKEVKELLGKTGDLRLLTKDNGEVRISDLFLNGDGYLRLEQYSTINKEELNEHLCDGKLTGDSVDSLLGCVKLWTLVDEDENTDENYNSEDLEWFFKNYEMNKVAQLPVWDFNDTVIDFMNSDIEEVLFRGTTSLN